MVLDDLLRWKAVSIRHVYVQGHLTDGSGMSKKMPYVNKSPVALS